VANPNGSANGAARYQSDKVRVAIIGVGNCASGTRANSCKSRIFGSRGRAPGRPACEPRAVVLDSSLPVQDAG